MQDTKSAPNGGWGWFVVASAHLSMMMWDGDTKALAVLLPTLTDQFNADTWTIGWLIGGLSMMLELTGPIVGAINDNTNVDRRLIAMLGGVLASIGFIGGSYATNILQLTICISVFGGIGLGLAFVQSTSLVPHYFDSLYPRASAIVTCGTCVAMIIFAPLTQMFLDAYGWRGTLLLIGGINMHLIFSGSFLRPITSPNVSSYSTVASNDITLPKEITEPISLNVCSRITNATKHLFPALLFGNPIYILHMLIFCCSAFVLSGWFIFLVPHAIEKGLSPYEASAISSAAAVVSFIGRIGFIPFVEKEIVQIRTAMYGAIAISAASLFIDPWMNSFWSLMLSSSLYFFGRGIYKSLFFVILNANIGVDHLASGLGWCLAFGGIFRAVAGGTVGWIYDRSGSYDYGFLLLGGVEMLSAILLFIEDMFRRRRLTEMENVP